MQNGEQFPCSILPVPCSILSTLNPKAHMYVIIVYDIEQKRVAKICKYLRRYLNWVQNSVFEGEVTPAKLKEIKMGLKQRINKEKDAVLFYEAKDKSLIKRETMGMEKNPTDTFI